MSTVATKNVSICKEKMDCTMMSKVSIFISVKTVFTTMPKKAVASIQAGFLATKTVCVSIIPTGPKQTKGVNLDAYTLDPVTPRVVRAKETAPRTRVSIVDVADAEPEERRSSMASSPITQLARER